MIFAFTALIVGAGYGYVAQRGAFCMNSGVNLALTRKDATKLKAYGLAIGLQLLVVPWLVAQPSASAPTLLPLGAIVGGLLFGASMPLAAGCAAGVWYKAGAGSGGALLAVAAMAAGGALLDAGPLSGLRQSVQSAAPPVTPILDGLMARIVPSVVGVVLLAWLLRLGDSTAGDWSWRRTGLLMGMLAIVAWPLSILAGRPFGMAVMPGTIDLVTPADGITAPWDALFVLAVPMGAFVAARRLGPVHWSAPSLAVAARRVTGGFGLGVGASLAAGCTVGHGLTGVPLLAPGSVVATMAIFVGAALTTMPTLMRARG